MKPKGPLTEEAVVLAAMCFCYEPGWENLEPGDGPQAFHDWCEANAVPPQSRNAVWREVLDVYAPDSWDCAP